MSFYYRCCNRKCLRGHTVVPSDEDIQAVGHQRRRPQVANILLHDLSQHIYIASWYIFYLSQNSLHTATQKKNLSIPNLSNFKYGNVGVYTIRLTSMAFWIADGAVGPTFRHRRETRLLWQISTTIAHVGLCDSNFGRITNLCFAKN
jgi:hypothetical protein